MNKEQVIIKYMGGLGNQMFQYALGEEFKHRGYKVLGDASWYEQDYANREFLLIKIFPNIRIDFINHEICERYEREHKNRSFVYKVYQYFFRTGRLFYYEKNSYMFEPSVFKMKNAIIVGYWQSYRYYENIRQNILDSFSFPLIENSGLIGLKNKMSENTIASIHVRGGDYLRPENEAWGYNCCSDYYLKAINLIKEKESQVIFWGFTDDLEYAKQVVPFENVEWIDIRQMEGYADWMDMYLMSLCKYNILANSSFSWWSAYLNQNVDGIVIAPKKWDRRLLEDEICPKEWIRI